jgi:hypothetical protein
MEDGPAAFAAPDSAIDRELGDGMAERVTESGRAVLEKPSHGFVGTL